MDEYHHTVAFNLARSRPGCAVPLPIAISITSTSNPNIHLALYNTDPPADFCIIQGSGSIECQVPEDVSSFRFKTGNNFPAQSIGDWVLHAYVSEQLDVQQHIYTHLCMFHII